jgi:heat shock protein HslJ
LPGTTWLVDRIVEPDGSVRRGTGETVSFGADGRIALSSCNLCSGPYTITSAGVLTLAPTLACTRRGCPDGATELERELTGPLRTSRDGEYLVLTAAEGGRQVLLLPDAAVQPDAESN